DEPARRSRSPRDDCNPCHAMAATNKCLAHFNKSGMQAKATKKCVADITATDLARPNGPPPHHALAALEDRSMSEESNKQCSMELTDTALEARLFPDVGAKQGHRRQVEPDWASIPNPVGAFF